MAAGCGLKNLGARTTFPSPEPACRRLGRRERHPAALEPWFSPPQATSPLSGYDRAIKRLRATVEAVAAEERGERAEIAPWGLSATCEGRLRPA